MTIETYGIAESKGLYKEVAIIGPATEATPLEIPKQQKIKLDIAILVPLTSFETAFQTLQIPLLPPNRIANSKTFHKVSA